MRPSPTSLRGVSVPEEPRWPDGVPQSVDCVRLPRAFLWALFSALALIVGTVLWMAAEVRSMRGDVVSSINRR